MTPRTFEDWLRELVRHGDPTLDAAVNAAGEVTVSVQLPDKGPKVFRVIESRVEPATFDSPSQGGSDEA